VAIGRRAHGHGLRRRPGVTVHRQSDGARRATGQAQPRPGPRGVTDPPRTTRTSRRDGKTLRCPGDQSVSHDLEHRPRGHRINRPVHDSRPTMVNSHRNGNTHDTYAGDRR
jgi:hypothetical protein